MKKLLHNLQSILVGVFNKYELQYRVLMLIAVVYLLVAHTIGC